MIVEKVSGTLRADQKSGGRPYCQEVAQSLVSSNPYGDQDGRESPLVAHTLRADGFDASEDGTGRGTPIIPVMAFQGRGSNLAIDQDIAGTLGTNIDRASGGAPCIAFNARQDPGISGPVTPPLDTDGGSIAIAFDETQITSAENRSQPGPGKPCHTLAESARPPTVAQNNGHWSVRRLTPVECERLQGLPDDWTRIRWRGKPAGQCPDGPRYAAIGNAWSVNVASWIGERIDLFERVVLRGRAA